MSDNGWTSFSKEATKNKFGFVVNGNDDVTDDEAEMSSEEDIKNVPSSSSLAPMPKKSALKKRNAPVEEDESDSDLDFSIINSSDDDSNHDDSDSADDLPSEFLHKPLDGISSGDFRRLFTLGREERDAFKHRKVELHPFFPPKHPDENAAALRTDLANKEYDEWIKNAWKGSVSADLDYRFVTMRQKIRSSELIRKYNQHSSKQWSTDILPVPARERSKRMKFRKLYSSMQAKKPRIGDESSQSQ